MDRETLLFSGYMVFINFQKGQTSKKLWLDPPSLVYSQPIGWITNPTIGLQLTTVIDLASVINSTNY